MGIWDYAKYAVPVYGQYSAVKDTLNSDALTNANVPTKLQDRDQIKGLIDQGFAPGGMTQQNAPQAGAAQMQLGADPFRQGQVDQMGQLQRVASGQQQGAGELAAQRQIAQAVAAQQAQARMARGGNAALAYRNAANQSAALGSTGAGMSQQAAMQDQQQAQAALTGALNAGRAGDINVAGQNAGFQQQTGLANAQFQQQNQQQNAQNYLHLLQQLYGLNATELGYAQAPVLAANQTKSGLLGAGLSAGGQMLGAAVASDERLKTDVADASREIDDMLDKLAPKSGVYRDAKHGDGRWNWIMAQDLERSAAGARVVQDTPEGKMLDVKKALSTALASVARLNTRLRAVEAR